ncbi:hypothetical protein NKH77_46745 [Streptomyces sp. M19]
MIVVGPLDEADATSPTRLGQAAQDAPVWAHAHSMGGAMDASAHAMDGHSTDGPADHGSADHDSMGGGHGGDGAASDSMSGLMPLNGDSPADETVAAYGPDVSFGYTFSRPGHYRVWIQVERDSAVLTIPYLLKVRSGEGRDEPAHRLPQPRGPVPVRGAAALLTVLVLVTVAYFPSWSDESVSLTGGSATDEVTVTVARPGPGPRTSPSASGRAGERDDPPATVTVQAVMPTHGHATAATQAQLREPGSYFTAVHLMMPGRWTLRVGVAHGSRTEHVDFPSRYRADPPPVPSVPPAPLRTRPYLSIPPVFLRTVRTASATAPARP